MTKPSCVSYHTEDCDAWHRWMMLELRDSLSAYKERGRRERETQGLGHSRAQMQECGFVLIGCQFGSPHLQSASLPNGSDLDRSRRGHSPPRGLRHLWGSIEVNTTRSQLHGLVEPL